MQSFDSTVCLRECTRRGGRCAARAVSEVWRGYRSIAHTYMTEKVGVEY
jgi:hypothetical protein